MPVAEGLGDYTLIEVLNDSKAYPPPTYPTVDLSLADPLWEPNA